MIVASFPQSPSPGLEQIDYWHSSSAHKKGSRNYIGIEDPFIDNLVIKITNASTIEELQSLTSTLDRALLWNYYVFSLISITFVSLIQAVSNTQKHLLMVRYFILVVRRQLKDAYK